MLSNITLGQYYPGHSFLHRLDPRAKILCTMVFICSIFFAQSLLSYGIITAFVLFSIAISQLPLSMIWNSIKPLWIIILFTMAVHMMTTPGTALWDFGWLRITEEGIHQGILMTSRLIFLIVFSSLLTYTTSPIVLTDGIEHLLHPFRRIGVPAHELAMMMTIALRFIPTLIEETDRIMKAQTARGASFSGGNLWQRAKSMIPLLVPLFISAFRRADELATAMEARCYRGGEGRSRLKELQYTFRDGLAGIGIALLTLILAYLRWGL